MKKILPISGAIVASGAIAYFIYQYCKRKADHSIFDEREGQKKKKNRFGRGHYNAKNYSGPSAHVL